MATLPAQTTPALANIIVGDLRRAMQHSCQTTTTTTNLTAGGISHLQLEAWFFLKKPSAHTPGCPGRAWL